MKVIWHGTASIEIRQGKDRLLFDPFVPLKGSEFDLDISAFDSFPDVFITHGHLDHIASIPKIASRNPGMRIFATRTPCLTLVKKGVPKSSLRLLGYGDDLRLGPFRIRVFHSKHAELPKASFGRVKRILSSPARGNIPYIARENARCPENGETVLYHIRCTGRSVSLMGSLNLLDEVRYPVGSDCLILPYNGWEDNCPPAVRAIERLKPEKVLLDHYDVTFPPLSEPVDLTGILERYQGRAEAMEHGREYDV